MSQILLKAPLRFSHQFQARALSTQLCKLASHPTSIRPSTTEIQNARLSPQNLEVAMRSLHQDGLVVVENVIPHDSLDRLNAKMTEDAYTLRNKKDGSPFNYNPGNIQQDAPPVRGYFDPQIFLSKLQRDHKPLPPLYTIANSFKKTPLPRRSLHPHWGPVRNGHFVLATPPCHPPLSTRPCPSRFTPTPTLRIRSIPSHM